MFKRTEVFCKNCGFLRWQTWHASGEGPYKYEEFPKFWRDGFQSDKFKGFGEDPENEEYFELNCLRMQWVWSPHTKTRTHGVDLNDVKISRKCIYYIEYQPGFGPEEHKELKREAETNRNLQNAALLGAAIGATAAIIAQLLYILLVPLLK